MDYVLMLLFLRERNLKNKTMTGLGGIFFEISPFDNNPSLDILCDTLAEAESQPFLLGTPLAFSGRKHHL